MRSVAQGQAKQGYTVAAMAKPNRSPLLGYNHNVKYRGRIFHIQTEDSGPANPHLFTHLFFEGTILASKRHVYDATSPDELVRTLMQGQHKALLKELKGAVHDVRISAFFGARGEFLEPVVEAQATAHRALDLDALDPPAAPPVSIHAGDANSTARVTALNDAPDTAPFSSNPLGIPILEAEALLVVEAEISGPLPSIYETLPESLPAPVDPGGPGIYRKRPTGPERPFEKTPIPRPVAAPIRSITPPVVVIPPPRRKLPTRPSSPLGTPASGVSVQRSVGVGDSQNRPTPVAVQRTVTVGGTMPNPSPGTMPPRPRRPAQVPYVVREGSHQLSGHRSADSPPARPLGPVPTTPPRTMSRPVDPNAPIEIVADKSLDEVILAYLAHGGKDDPK